MFHLVFIVVCLFSSSFLIIPSLLGPMFKYYNELQNSVKNLDVDIINGNPAAEGQFPWQVALDIFKPEKEFCGGSLISNQWVLTAAHCVDGAVNVTVSLGSVKLRETDPNRVVRQSTLWILHENYTPSFDNDVAVVFLSRGVAFNVDIQPVLLTADRPVSGTIVTVSGWGLTSDSDNQPSSILNYVNLITISDTECEEVYDYLPVGASCAHQLESLAQGTCRGDSGGPLVAGNVHLGVISFGYTNGCENGQPIGFARTDFYRDWIKTITGV